MSFKVESNITPISNVFIDEYMPQAPSGYVIMFLYAYRHCLAGTTELTNEKMAQSLHVLETDVMKAWEYWQEQGILKIQPDGGIEFLPIVPKQEKKTRTSVGLFRQPPDYSPEEMSKYMKNDIVKGLMISAQDHLGRLLSQNDMSILFGFYDWLGLPVEVIEILLAYCAQNNHRNINYIEKVALNWAEEGITSAPQAVEHIKMRKEGHREIFRAFGITGRMPTPSEEKYMKKWKDEYGFSMEILCLACEKTVMQTGKVSFAYADKILETWKKQKVKTAADIQKLEESFVAAKKAKQAQKEASAPQKGKQPAKPVKQNRFVNYEQRQWDFQELERLELERRQQEKK